MRRVVHVCALSSARCSAQPPSAARARGAAQGVKPALAEHGASNKDVPGDGLFVENNGEVTLNSYCQEGLSQGH